MVTKSKRYKNSDCPVLHAAPVGVCLSSSLPENNVFPYVEGIAKQRIFPGGHVIPNMSGHRYFTAGSVILVIARTNSFFFPERHVLFHGHPRQLELGPGTYRPVFVLGANFICCTGQKIGAKVRYRVLAPPVPGITAGILSKLYNILDYSYFVIQLVLYYN